MLRLPLSIGGRDVVVGVADAEVTLRELADTVTGPRADGSRGQVLVDTTPLAAGTPVVDVAIRPGDDVDPPQPARLAVPPMTWAVHIVAGIDAGRVIPIRNDLVTVGRNPGMDVLLRSNGVSGHHCTLTIAGSELWVTDNGSRNGTVVDGEAVTERRRVELGQPIRCGPAIIIVRAVPAGDTPANVARLLQERPAGPVPFYRSPIDLPDGPGPEVPLPPAPRDPRLGRPGLLALLLPAAMAGGLVYFTGQWFYAMFALMGPIMLLVTSVDKASRNRRIRKRSRRRYSDEMDDFAADLAQATEHELRRRQEALPDLTEIVRRCTGPGVALWTRRQDHPWYLALSLGVGDVPWDLPVEEVPDELLDVEELVGEHKVLSNSPVEVRATPGTTIGLAGSRAVAVAHARALLLATAAFHGPADVRVVVVTGRAELGEWDWTKWLPHLRPTFTDGRLLVLVADEEGRIDGGEVDDVLADVDPGVDLVALIDTPGLADAGDVAIKRLLRRSDRPATGIVIAQTVDGLPDQTDVVVEHHEAEGEATVRRPREAGYAIECVVGGLSVATATMAAKALAGLADPDAGGGSTALPARTGLGKLLALDGMPASEVSARWSAAAALPHSLRVVVGMGESGPMAVDLAAVGPHLAVIGARGSGKTEHLSAIVLSLAAANDPEDLHLVLWGESFSHLHRLPHVASSVSRVDENTLTAFLEGLDRELSRRERLRTAAGRGDADQTPRSGTDEPRLVVVIDDVDGISRIVPTAGDGLIRTLRRARGVGVHVVWSTGKATGGALPDLLDLSPIRVVLRVGSGPESTDLMGSDVASRLERSLPGRGFVVAGRGEPVEVQGGAVSVGAPRPAERLEVEPFTLAEGRRGFSRIVLGPPDERTLVNLIAAAGATAARPPDLLSPSTAAASAVPSPGLLELLGVDGLGALPDAIDRWIDTDSDPLLRLPIGVDPEERPVLVDLKESAHNGMGPHGLLVGATGSGKSELLRTLVGGLALTHSPEVLAFVLIDFKGGASFASLGRLPHVAGVVTNLADDLALVDRILAALGGEQRRRQELLAQAGNLANVGEYRAARRAGRLPEHLADMPMPELVMVVDEFAELLDQEPAFIDFFLTIGRVGRSLGIHMLLASQRLEEGKLRGLDTYLSYRLGLRTFSAAESRIVLGTPDAYSLPQAPGGGYLKVGSTTFERFQGSYVSGPIDDGEPGRSASDDGGERTMLDAIVDELADAAPPVHQIWLPPLADEIALDRQFPAGFVHDQARGFAAAQWPGTAALATPIGILDEPAQQRQLPLVLDFAGAHGNLAVAGAPQTGKSLLLRTTVLSLAVTHTPDEVQIYGVDFGGGTLGSLSDLPHVGTVATRQEPERVRRVIGHVEGVLERREALFGELGIDSVATLRRMRSAGDESPSAELERGGAGDVFLVIDGWAAFRERFEGLEPVIADLASRGLGYGVHVVVTLNRWTEMRSNVLDSIGGRLELRLNSAIDSMVDRKRAAVIRVDQPGRGLHPSGLIFQAALPRLDGNDSAEHLPDATKVAVEHITARWEGSVAPPVRLLPARIARDELPPVDEADGAGPLAVPVGLREQGMAAWRLDLNEGDPHFLVYGDGESGKTTFLETWLTGLAAGIGADEAQIVLVDYRRTLLESIPESHLRHYAASEPAACDVLAEVAEEASARLPGADVTAAQLRERSWWSGPELFVVVDDYDLVVTPTGNPLTPLVPLLAQGRDVGLHLVLARRVAGAAKALYEPVTSRLREVSPAGLILSGDREEGPILGGVRAGEQPPGRGVLVNRRSVPSLVQVAVP